MFISMALHTLKNRAVHWATLEETSEKYKYLGNGSTFIINLLVIVNLSQPHFPLEFNSNQEKEGTQTKPESLLE